MSIESCKAAAWSDPGLRDTGDECTGAPLSNSARVSRPAIHAVRKGRGPAICAHADRPSMLPWRSGTEEVRLSERPSWRAGSNAKDVPGGIRCSAVAQSFADGGTAEEPAADLELQHAQHFTSQPAGVRHHRCYV